MATFKGENSTISLKEEDNGYAQPLTDYTGAKVFQNNSGSFQPSRNSLESEARTPNAELSGQRLGNKNNSASFPVEIDATNYDSVWESCLYSTLAATGSAVTSSGIAVTSTSAYTANLAILDADQATVGITIGDAFQLSAVSESSITSQLEGFAVVTAIDTDLVTFYLPQQTATTISSITSDITVTPVRNMRPAKTRKSFNAEETLIAEDGTTTARFMSTGAIVSGMSIDLPSEGILTATTSFVASNYIPSADYATFDTNLTNSSAAHTATVAHETQEPLVLQDGAIISDSNDIRCQWISGTVNIENNTEPFFTGCNYEARGAISGAFRVTLSYEALFESEEDFRSFENETTSRVFLRLKDRSSDKSILIYLPRFKRTAYTLTNDTGLVTASVEGTALIEDATGNSLVLAIANS